VGIDCRQFEQPANQNRTKTGFPFKADKVSGLLLTQVKPENSGAFVPISSAPSLGSHTVVCGCEWGVPEKLVKTISRITAEKTVGSRSPRRFSAIGNMKRPRYF